MLTHSQQNEGGFESNLRSERPSYWSPSRSSLSQEPCRRRPNLACKERSGSVTLQGGIKQDVFKLGKFGIFVVGSKGEIFSLSTCFPHRLRQRTCGGCSAMTVSCHRTN